LIFPKIAESFSGSSECSSKQELKMLGQELEMVGIEDI
jgi:hypothetical protein